MMAEYSKAEVATCNLIFLSHKYVLSGNIFHTALS